MGTDDKDLGLGGGLKKPDANKSDAPKKTLAGGLGGEQAPTLGSAPSAPVAFEFEDDAPKKSAETSNEPAPSFNPFDDANVNVPTSASPGAQPIAAPADKPGTGRVAKTGTDRIEKPGTGRIEKPGTGRIQRPGTDRLTKPERDFGDNLDVVPGTAKDLWTCPHCGAKNKPQRETCRDCKKHPDDPVEKPWFMKPAIIGPVAGGVIVLIVLIMLLGGTDLSLKPAGVVDSSVRATGTTEQEIALGKIGKLFVKKDLAVSGRVIKAERYIMAPWLLAVGLALGSDAQDDDTFGTYTAEIGENGMTVTGSRHVVLYLYFEGEYPDLQPGDYLSLVGKAGVPEQNATVVRGTNESGVYTVKVTKFNTR